MSNDTIEFPDLIELNDYGGNYTAYESALLARYDQDLWKGGLTFNGLNVIPRVHQKFNVGGKSLDWTFAHFTSKGDIDEERELDLRRCERLGYIKPIIMNAHTDCVKVWENDRANNRGGRTASIVLWCEQANSKIVLTKVERKGREYYVITTFYLINDSKRIKNHNKEYELYNKTNGKYEVSAP